MSGKTITLFEFFEWFDSVAFRINGLLEIANRTLQSGGQFITSATDPEDVAILEDMARKLRLFADILDPYGDPEKIESIEIPVDSIKNRDPRLARFRVKRINESDHPRYAVDVTIATGERSGVIPASGELEVMSKRIGEELSRLIIRTERSERLNPPADEFKVENDLESDSDDSAATQLGKGIVAGLESVKPTTTITPRSLMESLFADKNINPDFLDAVRGEESPKAKPHDLDAEQPKQNRRSGEDRRVDGIGSQSYDLHAMVNDLRSGNDRRCNPNKFERPNWAFIPRSTWDRRQINKTFGGRREREHNWLPDGITENRRVLQDRRIGGERRGSALRDLAKSVGLEEAFGKAVDHAIPDDNG